MRLKEVIQKFGNIGEEEIKRISQILEEVKKNLSAKVDDLENKKYDNGWKEVLEPLTGIKYIEQGFFGNLAQALNDNYTRKQIVEFIKKLSAVKGNLYQAFKELLSDSNIRSIQMTGVSTLGHIFEPNRFIPLNHKISKAVRMLGIVDIHLAATQEYGKAIEVFNTISETIGTNPVDWIKTAYALYNYGKETNPPSPEPEEDIFKLFEQLLKQKGQIILYGVPGTGKTWLARMYVENRTQNDRSKYEFITFHQSYSYEDFVEGFRPKTKEAGNGNENIIYEVEDGIFKKMCIRAIWEVLKKKENREDLLYDKEAKQKVIQAIENKELTKEDFQNAPEYYLIIDEINRGNISNILGELITLLEKDKRLTGENEIIVTLPYSKEPFAVPPNLYIIGTMNTADRSIALLDVALRRRFAFIEIEPDYDLINKEIEGINLAKLLKSLNDEIVKLKDRDHRIGHSYFLKVKNMEDLKFVWFYEIIPLLIEYFYNDWESLKKILKDFIEKEEVENETVYRIKRYEEFDKDNFIKTLKKLVSETSTNQSSNSQQEGGE